MSEEITPEPWQAEYQLTTEEAIEFGQTKRWEPLSPAERGIFQLRQEMLCMPFDKFHEGITELLGRPVYTHEFANPEMLWDEYTGKTPKADLAAILAKLPEHLQVVVAVVKDDDNG